MIKTSWWRGGGKGNGRGTEERLAGSVQLIFQYDVEGVDDTGTVRKKKRKGVSVRGDRQMNLKAPAGCGRKKRATHM